MLYEVITYSEFNDYRYFEPSPVVGVQPADDLGNFGSDKIVHYRQCETEITGSSVGYSTKKHCHDSENEGLIEIKGIEYAVRNNFV